MTVEEVGPAGEFEKTKTPLSLEAVPAGFPSPAADYTDRALDLNELLIKHPAATYFVRAQGDSMVEAGISPGDILVVDKSLNPTHGDIVIAEFDGQFTVKMLELRPKVRLVPMSDKHAPIEVPETSDLTIFGVVTSCIHSFRKP